ncbi:MAG: HAD family hydrolase [Chloroflexi bacterium]|nr:HAD family hydrolase [Chloroflexota bacterium]
MIKAVLLDLDDTLVGNHMDTFMPRYFALLSRYAEVYLPPDQFVRVLLTSSQAMIMDSDPALTNREVFWQTFEAQTGLAPAVMEPFFDTFYREQFSALAAVTQFRETAVSLVNFVQQQGYKVVIATNPMFPRQAVLERLRWAGLPADEFNFDLITSYENMHSTKPNRFYYQEILQRIGVAAAGSANGRRQLGK